MFCKQRKSIGQEKYKMGKNKKRRRAYLDDFKKNENGQYTYEGTLYRLAGDEKTRKKRICNMLLACGVLLCSVILNGFLPVPGLQNSAFVLLPYAVELIASVSCCVGMARMLAAGRREWRLREYIYESTVQKLPGRSVFAAFCAGAAAIGECLYLFLNRTDIVSWFVFLFFILEAVSIGSALQLGRELKTQKWEKV